MSTDGTSLRTFEFFLSRSKKNNKKFYKNPIYSVTASSEEEAEAIFNEWHLENYFIPDGHWIECREKT